MPFQITAGP